MLTWLREYLAFLRRYGKWFLIALSVLLALLAVLLFLNADDLPIHFIYALY